jgi:hypothetical protein
MTAVSFFMIGVDFWKNKVAKVRKFPELARGFGMKTGEKVYYCHFVSFFLLA